MTRSPREHCDEIDLVLVLGTHGWTDLYLIISGKVHAYLISHVMSDPLEEMISLCNALIDRSDSWIRLHGEPGATLVRTTVDRRQRHLVELAVFYSDSWDETPDDAELQLSVTVKSKLLIDQIGYQLYKIEALCKEPSYARDRSRFPTEIFMDLIAKWKDDTQQGEPGKAT